MAKINIMGIMRDLEEEERSYQKRCDAIKKTSASIRRDEIVRICTRFEFESDEFMTAEEKAKLYLKTGTISARY